MSFGGGGGSSSIHAATDVALSNPIDGQVLGYNGGLAKWQNQTAATEVMATTSTTGTVRLAGDLGGSGTTANAPVIGSIQGVAISGTPASGQVLTATGSTAASWQASTGTPTGGTTGQLLRKNTSTNGDASWSDYLHGASHAPGQPDDVLQHKGRLSSTSLIPFDMSSAGNDITATSGILYLVHVTSWAAFTATRIGGVQSSSTSPTSQTLARFGLYTYDATATGSNNAYTLVASTPSDTTLFTSGSSQTSAAIVSKSFSTNYSITFGQTLALAFISLNAAGPHIRAISTNAAYSDTSGLFGNLTARQLASQTDLPTTIPASSAFATTINPFLISVAA